MNTIKNIAVAIAVSAVLLPELQLHAAPDNNHNYAWRSTAPIKAPDFFKYFPADADAGKKLDKLVKNKYKDAGSDQQYLELVRKGFRSTRQHRSLILARIGNKYIWNRKKQNPLAIELMYHASNNPNKYERHYAIYFGLSVVRPKTPAILKTLVDIAMTTDDFNDTGRIAWGAKDQRDELLKYLQPYLANDNLKTREHAQALKDIFSGRDKAFSYWKKQKVAKAEKDHGSKMTEYRNKLETGDSKTRLEIMEIMRKNHLNFIIKDHDAWMRAFTAAAADNNAKVRRWIAQSVGGSYVWNAKEIRPDAVDLLLKLARDSDRQVRYDAMYYGLNRLPKNHPASKEIEKIRQAAQAKRIEEIRQRVLAGIKNKEYENVEKFLRMIKPSARRRYRPGEKEQVQKLYDEISEKLSEARKINN